MNKCYECGKTEDDVLTFDNNQQVYVKLVKSRYGLLCQRHAVNAYARKVTSTKRQRRIAEAQQQQEDAGQLRMFDE